MAELPGWDRDRLAIAPEADVEAARWMVYATVLKSEIAFDYPGAIRQAELAMMSAKGREREEGHDRKRHLELLRQNQRVQAGLRKNLLLDTPDSELEPEDDA